MVIQKITGNIKKSLTLGSRHATKKPAIIWEVPMKRSGDHNV
jgi:hypothetical protein